MTTRPADDGAGGSTGADDGSSDRGGAAPTRREVVVAGHRGDTALARRALTDPRDTVREAAVGALERTGDLDAATLAAALADPSARVRARAALAAAVRTDVAGPLLGLLSDPDPSVVEVAAFSWGERPADGPDAVAALSRVATGHDDHLCREAAVAALGSVGDPAGLPAVLGGCEDRANVRRRAVVALAAFEGPEVTAALERALEDRDLQVRQAAEDLLEIEREG